MFTLKKHKQYTVCQELKYIFSYYEKNIKSIVFVTCFRFYTAKKVRQLPDFFHARPSRTCGKVHFTKRISPVQPAMRPAVPVSHQ